MTAWKPSPTEPSPARTGHTRKRRMRCTPSMRSDAPPCSDAHIEQHAGADHQHAERARDRLLRERPAEMHVLGRDGNPHRADAGRLYDAGRPRGHDQHAAAREPRQADDGDPVQGLQRPRRPAALRRCHRRSRYPARHRQRRRRPDRDIERPGSGPPQVDHRAAAQRHGPAQSLRRGARRRLDGHRHPVTRRNAGQPAARADAAPADRRVHCGLHRRAGGVALQEAPVAPWES